MKKIIHITLLLSAGINLFSQDDLVNSVNEFTLNFYEATKPDSSNFFISPFSINTALAIAREGATASTKKELDCLLEITNKNIDAEQYQELIESVTIFDHSNSLLDDFLNPGNNSQSSLYLANSLWINDDIQVHDSFINTITQNYNSDLFGFSKYNIAQANIELNNWVSEKTNHKISEIEGLRDDIKLSILNAIYFMGEWQYPFDKKNTKEKKFHTIEREKKVVSYMRKQSHHRYYEDYRVQALYIPYGGCHLSMLVLLPQKRYGISTLEENLTSDYFKKIKKESYSHEVILSLPKFKIESEILPKSEIIKMGYPIMFSDSANFSGISDTLLKIDKITHKSFIEINELRTEAAAVTKVDMVVIGYGSGGSPPPPPPKIFNADHPFIFFIVDESTNMILFSGRYVK